MTDAQINKMVDRFLGWPLPADFCPDAGISFEPEYNVEYMAARGLPPSRHQPAGTNLFSADQAKEMIKYIMGIADGSPMESVLNEIASERNRQDEKWGGPNHDDEHSTAEFVQWIEDYAGWARMMASMNSHEKARRRLVQIAALAVAAVESIDRKEARRERMTAFMGGGS